MARDDIITNDLTGCYAGGIGGIGDLEYLGEDDAGNLYAQATGDPKGEHPVFLVECNDDPSRRGFVSVDFD